MHKAERLLPRISQLMNTKAWFPFELNEIQRRCEPVLSKTNENVVITAPTGSGKTALFEMAMLRSLDSKPTSKIVFLAPMRAICEEKHSAWSERLAEMGKSCLLLIGDTDTTESDFKNADVLISTPEKWDFVTRTGYNTLECIALVLIDEVHHLNDTRGAVLECVVARMKMAAKGLRFVAVSATIPNARTVALWLNEARLLAFPDSMRPVPLEWHVLGTAKQGKNSFTFEYSLNYRLPELITKHSPEKPVLIFCSTRKSAVKTVEFLKIHYRDFASTGKETRALFEDEKLAELVPSGYAFHHAGLSASDRSTIETRFKSGQIRVLCATSTLAVGVNLPAHLVVIKSTECYNGTAYSEYSELDILQMMGRAGRLQYDSKGVVVILTEQSNVAKYQALTSGKAPIESRFQPHCIDYLNCEIALGSIASLQDATRWFRGTFLHQCALANPAKYFQKPSLVEADIQKALRALIDALIKEGAVVLNGSALSPTATGRAMARCAVSFQSLKGLNQQVKPSLEIGQLLQMLCKSPAFDELRYRPGDKAVLHRIATHPKLRFPAGDKLFDPWLKAFYLLQAPIQAALDDVEAKLTPSLRTDLDACQKTMKRLLRLVIEHCACRGFAVTLSNALELLSSLVCGSWPDDPQSLRQISGIGRAYLKTLVKAHICNVESLRALEAGHIEMMLRRNPPFGRKIHEELDKVPQLELRPSVEGGNLQIRANVLGKGTGYGPYHLLITSHREAKDSDNVVCYQVLQQSHFPFQASYPFSSSKMTVSLVCESFAGSNEHVVVESRKPLASTETKNDDEFSFVLSDGELTGSASQANPACMVINQENAPPHSDEQKLAPLPLTPVSVGKSHPIKDQSEHLPPKCPHPCRGQLACVHPCCKQGLLGNLARASNPTALSAADLKRPRLSNSIGGQRKISNAREWLRKYTLLNSSPHYPSRPVRQQSSAARLNKNEEESEKFDALFEEIDIELRDFDC